MELQANTVWVHKARPEFMVNEAALSCISACHHWLESLFFFFPFSSFLAPVFHIRNCRKGKPNVLKAQYKSSHIYLNEEWSPVQRAQTQINHSRLSEWTCPLMDCKCLGRLKCDSSYAVINKWWCLEMLPDRNLGPDSQDYVSSRLSSSSHLSPSLPEIIPFQPKVTGNVVRGQRTEQHSEWDCHLLQSPHHSPDSKHPASLRLGMSRMFAASIAVKLVRAKCRLKIFPEITVINNH